MSKLDLVRNGQSNGIADGSGSCSTCPMCEEIKALRRELLAEFREMRLMFQNSVPMPIIMKLLAPIFKSLCVTLLLLVIWLTGVKAYLPQIVGQ